MLTVSTQLLPFKSLLWKSEDEIIAAGYDCEAFRFKGGESGWEIAGTVEAKGAAAGVQREESALNMFRQMDLKGKSKDDTQLKTTHQNTVTTIRPYETSGGRVTKFTCKLRRLGLCSSFTNLIAASGVDGRVVIWDA